MATKPHFLGLRVDVFGHDQKKIDQLLSLLSPDAVPIPTMADIDHLVPGLTRAIASSRKSLEAIRIPAAIVMIELQLNVRRVKVIPDRKKYQEPPHHGWTELVP